MLLQTNNKQRYEYLRETIKYIFYYLFKTEKRNISLLIFITVIIGVTPSVNGILTQQITDLIESFGSKIHHNQIPQILFFWVVAYAIWNEILNILWRSYDYFYLKSIPKIKAIVIEELYYSIQMNHFDFFQKNLSGEITNNIMEASRSIELIFCYLNDKIIRKFFILLFSIITLYYVHHNIANILLVWIVLFLLINIYFAPIITKYALIYGKKRNVVAGRIVDSISNIFTIRIFNNIRKEFHALQKNLKPMILTDERMQIFVLKLRCFLGTTCSITIFLVLYYTVKLKTLNKISTGDCILVITLCLTIMEETWDLIEEFSDMFEHIGVFGQIINLFKSENIKNSIIEKKLLQDIEITNPTINFHNINFHYSNGVEVFGNLSLSIPAKQKIAIVGKSGSGKSTLFKLLTRINDVSHGQIIIDKYNINDITRFSIRKNITLIPQEAILFNRSIYANIAYGKENCTKQEVIEAAKAAHIHDMIMKLPYQYNTICGERGNNLSGGQKQRIIIARAFLRNTPILLIDEATSALDSETEQLITSSLLNLMKNRTVIVIAHKLSTIINMDRILILSEGKIVGDGTHQELVEQNEIYKTLWRNTL